MKDKMLRMIEKRIKAAKYERHVERSLDRDEYRTLMAELLAIRYEIEMMEG